MSPVTAEDVLIRLREAGAALLALPSTGCLPAGVRSAWPAFARAALEAYGYGEETLRPSPPSAKAITRMDEAFAWVSLIPREHNNGLTRRIVLMMSLTRPITGQRVFSHRRIGAMLGRHHETIRDWHAVGIDLIVYRLNHPGLCAASGGPVGPGRAEIAAALSRAAPAPVERRSRIRSVVVV